MRLRSCVVGEEDYMGGAVLVVSGPRGGSGEGKKFGFAPVYFWNGGGVAVLRKKRLSRTLLGQDPDEIERGCFAKTGEAKETAWMQMRKGPKVLG